MSFAIVVMPDIIYNFKYNLLKKEENNSTC